MVQGVRSRFKEKTERSIKQQEGTQLDGLMQTKKGGEEKESSRLKENK